MALSNPAARFHNSALSDRKIVDALYDRVMEEQLEQRAVAEALSAFQLHQCVPFVRRARYMAKVRGCLSYPETGSPLALDDLVVKPIYDAVKVEGLSSTAKMTALSAERHLLEAWPAGPPDERGMREVKFDPYTGFTLLRGSMEASAHALWLLEPTGSAERLSRFCSLTLKSQEEYQSAISAFHQSRGSYDSAKPAASIQALFDEVGIKPAKYPGSKKLLEKAGRYVPSGEMPWTPVVAWQVASGVAHSMPWSRIEAARTTFDSSTGRSVERMDAESYRYAFQASAVMFETLVNRIGVLQTAPEEASYG